MVALPLEGAEFCTCLASYLNFIFVGTNLGVRMCQTLAAFDPTGNQGDLRAGPLIPNITQPVNTPVFGVVGSGRFVYFSWCNYDEGSTGVGRMDLTNFIDALAPAYASDLMIDGQGPIFLDWDPINMAPLMAVQGLGLYTIDNANIVDSGTIESGWIVFDLADDKVAMSVGIRPTAPFLGSARGFMSVDQPVGENYSEIGETFPPLPATPWALNQLRAHAATNK